MADRHEADGEPVAAGRAADEPAQARPLRYPLGFFATAAVILGLLVTLPFSIKSVMDDVLEPARGRAIQITPRISEAPAAHHIRLLLAVTEIDEVQLSATFKVSGHHHCVDCAWSDRVLLVALDEDAADAETLPPSAAIIIAPSDIDISETVRLPLQGRPIHYPFDRYRIMVGVAYQRVHPGGRLETLSATEARGHFFLSMQELLPRYAMEGPFRLDPRHVRSGGHPFAYTDAFEARFDRPSYLRVLAAMLVILIAAVATYSVFWRPLDDLVRNSGALILSMWGIRSILTPTPFAHVTAVDLALSVVIIFTLGTLCVRVLLYAYRKAQLNLLR